MNSRQITHELHTTWRRHDAVVYWATPIEVTVTVELDIWFTRLTRRRHLTLLPSSVSIARDVPSESSGHEPQDVLSIHNMLSLAQRHTVMRQTCLGGSDSQDWYKDVIWRSYRHLFQSQEMYPRQALATGLKTCYHRMTCSPWLSNKHGHAANVSRWV